jgi:Spy/CpxP family protein refolding chaperone
MKKVSLLIATALMALSAAAQQPSQPQEKSVAWKKEKRVRSDGDSLAIALRHKERQGKIKERKIGYFTTRIEFTTEEAQAFWPLYNEYLEKRDKLFMERHNLMKKIQHDKFDDKKAQQVTKRLVTNMQDDANLLHEYNEKFSKILPPQKLLKYYAAEESFKMELINVLRKHDK